MAKQKILIEMRKHVITAIMAAFGFVIGLSWNDAIKCDVDELLIKLNIIGITYNIGSWRASIQLENGRYYKRSVSIQSRGE